MTIALGLVPLVLLLLGFPIFLVLLTAVTTAFVFFLHVPMAALEQTMFGALNVFPLLAIPFFLYAGELMGRGSVAPRIVDVVQTSLGSVRGGLGLTTIGTSAVFGAITGSSAATVATIGRIILPAMRKNGYPESFAIGLITATGAVDTLIPPSIPMIVYGAAAQESVPRLYAAGILPAILISLMLGAYVLFWAKRQGFAPGAPFVLKSVLRAFSRSLWALGAPAIILGGIYGGIFTPTEAAGVACIYAAFVTCVVYRDIPFSQVVDAASSTAFLTAQILIILACANVFSWLLTINQVPAHLVEWLQAQNFSWWVILLSLNIILLLVGCFIDPLSAILVLSPLLVPIVRSAGIDTIHFGIILMVNIAIGMFHPPFGLNIFVAQSVLRVPLDVIYRGIVPFLLVYLAALGLITYVPWFSLVGVRLFFPAN